MAEDFFDVISKLAIVIDNGSGVMKAGFAGEEKPNLVFPSYVGRPKHTKVLFSGPQPEVYMGSEAETNKGVLKIKYPIEHGIVNNWIDVEQLWRHIYTQLGVLSQEHPVLLTEPPLNPYRNRERTAEIFLESFSVPGIFFATQAVLSLYATGQVTGIVLDVGDGVTHCVPVYDGYALTHAITRTDLGGRDVTNYLANLLRRAGYIFTSSSELELVRQIKEKICYVALQISNEEKMINDGNSKSYVNYMLPDGNVISVGPERFRAPELLFQPEKVHSEQPGVNDCLLISINKADVELRKTLYQNIVLAGGSTLLQYFGDRLLNDLKKAAPKDIKIKISAPPDRKLLCWYGGSLMASLQAFKDMWITKKEYEEEGKRVLHSKTFQKTCFSNLLYQI